MKKIDNIQECVHVDINIFPTPPPPPPPPKQDIPEKFLKIMRKYKYNWRLDQLSRPIKKTAKFKTKIVTPLKYQKVKQRKLSEETNFYADQMSRPLLRMLVINKNLYAKRNGRKFLNKIKKSIKKSRASIYNFYKTKERDKKIRQLRRDAKKNADIKKTRDLKRFDELAKPKRNVQLDPLPKKQPSKLFDNYEHLEILAAPKPFVQEKPKRLGINPAALTYEPTETVLRLAEIPARFKVLLKPLEPGKVQIGALRYKITERVENLAVPKRRSEKAKVDEDYDPWAIPMNALKYKATTRILELAKPTERK